ncbi:MAG: hypothetical protein D9V45_11225 [Chloroflexi bacterium]|nr:MAG: hypothetical protein D9V45_11225 [Chloroflexota bacterium]
MSDKPAVSDEDSAITIEKDQLFSKFVGKLGDYMVHNYDPGKWFWDYEEATRAFLIFPLSTII